ncbi:MAG: DNA translocase FtsK [Oscillospiraceae bacterium]|jgi:S-DNA-T family DNA segregation ATPase FtsK/SpoIIIE|nr:DNA translocase FtsK [Oscillospiraceae bacterium]
MPARKKTPGSRKPIRREIGALVCFLLSVFTFFSLFGAEALLLNWLRAGVDFLLGGGFWLFPFACLIAAVVLLFHRGRPVVLRVVCVFAVPALFGVLVELYRAYGEEDSKPLLKYAADFLRGGLSAPVTTTLLVIGMAACVLAFLRLNPVAVVDALRSRKKIPYEPVPAPVPAPAAQPAVPAPKPAPSEAPKKKGRAPFDIPVYVGPGSEPEPPPPVGILRGRDEDVKTPAELVLDPPIGNPVKMKAKEVPKFPVEDAAPLMVPDPAAQAKEPAPDIPFVHQVAEMTIPAEDAEPYRKPPVSLLTATKPGQIADTSEELKSNGDRLLAALLSFGIGASIIQVTRGPSVTRYEIEPESGVKLATITSRSDDIALALGAVGVHIAPVPNKVNAVGVEVPNKLVSTVYIRDLIDSPEFAAADSPTAFVLGRDITGQNIVADIAKLTHLLIAGTTGSGKSVCMNTLITSMLYKASPEELRFIMVDPKMVELGVYNGIPHLYSPVVTEPKRAAEALEWAVTEMDKRYGLLMQRGKRDIIAYNEEVSKEPGGVPMPRIVIIIDEMADLMMVARKEVETAVARIAQKARACGVHLILATQRPEAKVVTGIIKANTPSRIAFAVKANLDSRIILDTGGAEKLVGRGDMLYLPMNAPKPLRVQGCFVSSEEVERVVHYIRGSGEPNYSTDMLAFLEGKNGESAPSGGGGGAPSGEGADPMLPAAIEAIVESGQGSTSYLQRRLKLGYARAARLMDEMEERGIVGPFEGSKPRQVLITPEQWEEMNGE